MCGFGVQRFCELPPGQLAVLGSVAALAVLIVLIVYYILLVRAILEMLDRDVRPILLASAFVALIPVPPIVVAGIVLLVIWHRHKKTASRTVGFGT